MRSQQSPSTSPTLLRNARAGNDQAWNELVRIYGPLVIRWTRQYQVASVDADDITQNVFITVSKNLAHFGQSPGEHTFRGWLWSITRTRILDHLRAKKRLPESLPQEQLAEQLGFEELSQDERLMANRDEDLQVVVRAAMELIQQDFSEKTWNAFYRTVALGESPSDVGRDLKMTAAAVCMCRARVLKRLRETIDEV